MQSLWDIWTLFHVPEEKIQKWGEKKEKKVYNKK